jgi:hypothetical protein
LHRGSLPNLLEGALAWERFFISRAQMALVGAKSAQSGCLPTSGILPKERTEFGVASQKTPPMS